MYAYGIEHDADIVAGRPAGKGRAVPRELFLRDRPRATLAKDPLADSLTPDKLFDRAFLNEHALRFPERQHPLAGQSFTTQALLKAGRAAVLGSYVCFHYRPMPSTPAVPPAAFCSALGALVRTANGLTEPGAARDRLHRRWLRVEVLDGLTGKRLLELDGDARRELFRALREVIGGGISATAVAGLPASRRLAIGLLTDDCPEDLVALARWEESVGCRTGLDELSWAADGTLRLGFTAELRTTEGPLGVTSTAAGRPALAPTGLSRSLLERFAREPLTGGADPGRASAVLVVRERASGAEYRLPTQTTAPGTDGALRIAGTARLDPATAVDGAPIGDGAWDLYVRLTALGWMKTARLGARRGPAVPEQLVARLGARGRLVTPYWTDPGSDLSLRVAVPPEPAPPGTSRGPGLLRRLRWRLLRRR
jgi:hypothetical protein